MRLSDGKNTISTRVLIAVFLLVAFACLTGCGSSAAPTSSAEKTKFIVVSDYGNNRVLIYNMPLSNGQSASVVLGQAGFTTATAALTAAGMNQPYDTAEDSDGNIYVGDNYNNRVLQFQPPFTSGMSASLVIGQPNFVTGNPSTTQNGLGNPGPGAPFIGAPIGLAFDGSGNLWVSDFSNCRILQYRPPFSTGMNASLVIGQANFTSNTCGTTNSELTGPEYIAFDASGNLWVTDTFNSRALEFKPPFVNGMAASLVIGQTDFVSSGAATTASGLDLPRGIAFDSAGNLWLGDTFNNRVLQFQPPFTSGMSASLVLGQASFTTGIRSITQSGLYRPFGIAFDSSGNLEVADDGNNRTLVFTPPFSTNMNASGVLGQANFTALTAATTATGQDSPLSVRAAF